ncbi:Uncharacterized protein BP5553_07535 [Venustampulla echinocandica]|uniref:Zn(2)-C6 fungal-type domain-containing protein n=1 Tax=Venustampulla echinocandica TaxID=2656787 RepID=A0A370TGT3_9HELO|nr:Uncharacterized protein BP5553_07535 [Venustampulla echinocandica]RDL34407.1 Uncharacterized protein BP5553_07535 [Venustampulla echinocandica]
MFGDVPEVEVEVEADPHASTTHSISPSASNDSGSGPATGASGKAPDKTISCVSCRKRKLRCDRIKPKCGTCERLCHECEYPERRRNPGSKRRNMKELEARLAEVETKLVPEIPIRNMNQPSTFPLMDDDADALREDSDFPVGQIPIDGSLDIEQWAFTFQPAAPSFPMEDPLSQELISLGLEEPLPPQQMIDELHDIYFEKSHKTMPLMHKYRYFASLDRAPHMRPPVCLRYAMWTMAASLSDKYSCYEDLFYGRARRYLEAAEMKGHGETFVTVYHAQAWGLISSYEAKRTLFSRSWMSTGRMTRLVQMLGLHRLDGDRSDLKQILPSPSDWIELEERRRTFWVAFHNDRWASSGTGWPMIINEKEILTNLPASENSFEQGIAQDTISLADALTSQGAPKISTFGGVILSAALFGHNFQHLHRIGPDERPENVSNGEFWRRHRKMDNVLSSTFLFLPDHLRMPGGLGDMNVVFLHMSVHASTVCLHQAAILTAERNKLDSSVTEQSRARSLMAAQEIANIMRRVCHVDASNMNLWMGFCLFVAAGVLLQDLKAGGQDPHPQSLMNLEFLVAALQAIGDRHTLTKHFTAQLELDIEVSGIYRSQPDPCDTEDVPIYNNFIDGQFSQGKGAPLPFNIARSFTKRFATQNPSTSAENPGASILNCLNVASPSNNTQRHNSNPTHVPYFTVGNRKVLPASTPAIQGDKIFRDSSAFFNLDNEFLDISSNTPSGNDSSSYPTQFVLRHGKYANKDPASSQNTWAGGIPTAFFFPTLREGTKAPDGEDNLDNNTQTADLDAMFEDIVWDPNSG